MVHDIINFVYLDFWNNDYQDFKETYIYILYINFSCTNDKT